MDIAASLSRLMYAEMVASLIAVLISVTLGSLPAGYLAGRRLRGLDIRRLSPHNLGLGTVAEAAGTPTLALVTALDLLKGALAVVVAHVLSGADWTLALSSAGVIAGHAYAPLRWLAPRATTRMKGVAVAMGTLVALAAIGAIPWAVIAICLGVAAGVLAIPRVIYHRWGYLSLAAVLGAVSLPVALWLLGGRTPYVVLGAAYALLTIWNHKEHLLRIADSIEPRLGERLPLPSLIGGEAVCAFMIHPLAVADVWDTNRFRWLRPLYQWGLIPDRAVRWIARFMRPMKVDDINPIITADGRRARVYIVGAPLLPDQIRAEPALAVHRAVQTAEMAASLGATVLGLGAFWSVVGNKGVDVQARSPIAITNGGAYTAGTIKMAVPLVLARLQARGADPARATAAVVGANGVVGFGICRAVIEHVGRLIMVGTDQERLDRSTDTLRRRYPGTAIETTTQLATLREADVIFTATSDPKPVIFPEHVKPGCLLFDLGRPLDVDASVKAVPGVEVIPGGVVRLPGDPRGQLDLGYGTGLVPACLAETIILALDGTHDRASLGDRTRSENIDYFVERAAAIGFEVQTGGQESTLTGAAGTPAVAHVR